MSNERDVLSAGQCRVREIVSDYAEEHQELKGSQPAGYRGRLEQIYATMQKLFSQDPIIKSDPITGQMIVGEKSTSKRSYEWNDPSNNQKLFASIGQADTESVVSHARLAYTRVAGSSDYSPMFAYSGGIKFKSDTTFSVLCRFAMGIDINPWRYTAVYYRPVQVLTINGGGNHRLLGQVLWGVPQIKELKIYDYTDNYTSNPRLEFWEQHFGGYFVSSSENFKQFKAERETMDDLHQDHTSQEIEVIKEFIKKHNRFGITPTEIVNLVHRLRQGNLDNIPSDDFDRFLVKSGYR